MGKTHRGYVYIAGAGPGDPGLITVKAEALLRTADVIVYDSLIDEALLSVCKPGAELIYAGKRAHRHSMEQEEINRLLVEKASAGRTVLRLKGGDPFVFGRGAEEAYALREAGISYEVVPGVTSAIAAPGAAGVPVTFRGEGADGSRSFTVVTAHTKDGGLTDTELSQYARLDGTLVFLMGLGALPKITEGLLRHGKPSDTPAAIIVNGTGFAQYVLRAPLSELSEKAKNDTCVITPAVIVIGAAAALDVRDTGTPAIKKSVLLTGTADFTKRLEQRILSDAHSAAFTLHLFPHLRLSVLPGARALLTEKELSAYTHLVFTGRSSVRIFWEQYRKNGGDVRALYPLTVAAIGRPTAEYLYDLTGIRASLVPKCFDSGALAGLLVQKIERPGEAHVFIPRAQSGSDVLKTHLTEAGISVTELALYRTEYNSEAERLLSDGPYDAVVFASAEGAYSYFKHGHTVPETADCIAIGPYTERALIACGCKHVITAESADVDGIAETLFQCFG